MQLLEATRDANGPSLVPEVTFELADDGGHRERGKLESAVRLETFDCLEEADERDLTKIVERLTPIRESPRQEFCEPHVLLDKLVPQVAIRVRRYSTNFANIAALSRWGSSTGPVTADPP